MALPHPAPPRQLPLDLPLAPGFGREDFFVSASNETAYATIEGWRAWPDPVLLLRGPAGSGKSHLGAIWAALAHAAIRPVSSLAGADVDALARGALLLEDADEAGGVQTELFHLLNLARERRTAVILTARGGPEAWGITLADLLSRLRQAPAVAIGAPDDPLLRAVLVKLLVDRQLTVDVRLVDFAATRLERSLEAARRFIESLDREALTRKTRISRQLAAEVLASMNAAPAGEPQA